MLTTIGDKIIEIRPKQIIESKNKIDNHYLVLLNKDETKKKIKRGRPKVVKNDGQKEHTPADSKASA
jgi:hypothetical protein